MPVEKAILEKHVKEAAGGDAELETLMMKKYTENDALAVKFVGGYTRTDDYTAKTQSVAEERRLLAEQKKQVDAQLSTYQEQLEAAETDKNKILKDLANAKITTAQANARLQHVKETYQLSDDDIPPMGDLIRTRKTGEVTDSTPDLDERMKALEASILEKVQKNLTETLIPELGGMATLPIVWNQIHSEHQDLIGKRLTPKEQRELLETASANKKSLVAAWEEKYDIGNVRLQKRDEDTEKRLREKWDSEQKARASEEAMQGIRPGAEQTGIRTSPILSKKFPTHEEKGDPAVGNGHPGSTSANERQALTGAERAAKVYLERRAQGIPMGEKPQERKSA